MLELIKAHGLRGSIEAGRVAVESPSPLVFVLDVQDRPTRSDTTMIQLNIATCSAIANKAVWHAFSGIGEDRPAAAREAFGKFIMGPFHTLLSAFGNHRCPSDGTVVCLARSARGVACLRLAVAGSGWRSHRSRICRILRSAARSFHLKCGAWCSLVRGVLRFRARQIRRGGRSFGQSAVARSE